MSDTEEVAELTGLDAALAAAIDRGEGEGDAVAAVAAVIDCLRPPRPEGATRRVVALCDRLEVGPADVRAGLGALLVRMVGGSEGVVTLVEAGMPSDRGFLDELRLRLGRRVLPEVPNPRDLRTVVRRCFPHRDDYRWVRAVPEAVWARLLNLVGIVPATIHGVPAPLAAAVRILAHHVASLGLSPDIVACMPEVDELDSPFLTLSTQVHQYTARFAAQNVEGPVPALDEVLATLAECRAAVQRLRENKDRHGTSLRMTGLSFRLRQQIDRLVLLVGLTGPGGEAVRGAAARLFVDLVEAECLRDSVRRHVKASADLLAYQVVEHAARKGAKYITDGRREYGRFLVSSMWGGVIVAIFALSKVLLGRLDPSPAGQALIYSLNYAACFVLIQVTGATLATKQPAMTANAIARSIDGPAGSHDLTHLADLVVRLWRSQFISFVGNLVCAFPLALALSEGVQQLWGAAPAAGVKADALLASVHPWQSGALLYAGVAGVFLFLAGLVSGHFDNRNLHRHISIRIAAHPGLRRWLGVKRAARLGTFVERKGGAIVGNVFLGFCLGSAGVLGYIVGLPFDIRHIAFSSANVGMAWEGLDFAVAGSALGMALLGTALIGFVNFFVSFLLAFFMAAESRQLTLRENRAVLGLLARRLLRRPQDWFFPPRAPAPPP